MGGVYELEVERGWEDIVDEVLGVRGRKNSG